MIDHQLFRVKVQVHNCGWHGPTDVISRRHSGTAGTESKVKGQQDSPLLNIRD